MTQSQRRDLPQPGVQVQRKTILLERAMIIVHGYRATFSTQSKERPAGEIPQAPSETESQQLVTNSTTRTCNPSILSHSAVASRSHIGCQHAQRRKAALKVAIYRCTAGCGKPYHSIPICANEFKQICDMKPEKESTFGICYRKQVATVGVFALLIFHMSNGRQGDIGCSQRCTVSTLSPTISFFQILGRYIQNNERN